MSYIVLKSTPSDNGWMHEADMWVDDERQAHNRVSRNYDHTLSCGRKDVRFNVIETDMEPWIDSCIGDGSYAGGIGGVFYIDESKLDL